ncbi:MAG: PIG-L family deacetylase [Alphaproteobacteria bacterium]|nr:PIG-L family deacetylase [Alphaproteobacteria bacterium]MCL2505869.1 PIG-L family deacetylase [Alphaproteobacteria bacterium]
MKAEELVEDYMRLAGASIDVPDISPISISIDMPAKRKDKCAVILAPHPDDECITGGIALRLKQELDWQIYVIPITLGSDESRKKERLSELSFACASLGFDCVLPDDMAFSDINPDARINTHSKESISWNSKVLKITEMLSAISPNAVFLPHEHDGHKTHIGTHLLGMDALGNMPHGFSCSVVMTEFWSPIKEANAFFELPQTVVASLVTALSYHKKEVARNPFNSTLPAYFIDCARRIEQTLPEAKADSMVKMGQAVRFGKYLKGRFVPSALKHIITKNQNLTAHFS